MSVSMLMSVSVSASAQRRCVRKLHGIRTITNDHCRSWRIIAIGAFVENRLVELWRRRLSFRSLGGGMRGRGLRRVYCPWSLVIQVCLKQRVRNNYWDVLCGSALKCWEVAGSVALNAAACRLRRCLELSVRIVENDLHFGIEGKRGHGLLCDRNSNTSSTMCRR
jgi:hypothetical protein